jgi:hypothetical protein
MIKFVLQGWKRFINRLLKKPTFIQTKKTTKNKSSQI